METHGKITDRRYRKSLKQATREVLSLGSSRRHSVLEPGKPPEERHFRSYLGESPCLVTHYYHCGFSQYWKTMKALSYFQWRPCSEDLKSLVESSRITWFFGYSNLRPSGGLQVIICTYNWDWKSPLDQCNICKIGVIVWWKLFVSVSIRAASF